MPSPPAKGEAGFRYLTLVCERDLLLTKLSLYSLAQSSTAYPQLVLALDESISAESAATALSFWPAPITFVTVETIAEEVARECGGLLSEFCRRHIFGFKLAACIAMSKHARVLYADSDVLWFQNPSLLMDLAKSRPIHAATDCSDSYNHKLYEFLPRGISLSKEPFPNAGLAIYNRGLHEIQDYADYLSAAISESPIHRFSEQGLVAALTKQSGDVISPELVSMLAPRRGAVRPSFTEQPWIARHYVSIPEVRQQFWIDAFWLRFLPAAAKQSTR